MEAHEWQQSVKIGISRQEDHKMEFIIVCRSRPSYCHLLNNLVAVSKLGL